MLQTGMLMGLGDFASQTLVERKRLKDVDGARVVRFGLIGAFYVAPIVRVSFSLNSLTFVKT